MRGALKTTPSWAYASVERDDEIQTWPTVSNGGRPSEARQPAKGQRNYRRRRDSEAEPPPRESAHCEGKNFNAVSIGHHF